jgi:hypothetical protein
MLLWIFLERKSSIIYWNSAKFKTTYIGSRKTPLFHRTTCNQNNNQSHNIIKTKLFVYRLCQLTRKTWKNNKGNLTFIHNICWLIRDTLVILCEHNSCDFDHLFRNQKLLSIHRLQWVWYFTTDATKGAIFGF